MQIARGKSSGKYFQAVLYLSCDPALTGERYHQHSKIWSLPVCLPSWHKEIQRTSLKIPSPPLSPSHICSGCPTITTAMHLKADCYIWTENDRLTVHIRPFSTSSYMYTGDPRPTLILTYQSDSFFHHIEFSSKFYEPVNELYKLKNKCAMKIYIYTLYMYILWLLCRIKPDEAHICNLHAI